MQKSGDALSPDRSHVASSAHIHGLPLRVFERVRGMISADHPGLGRWASASHVRRSAKPGSGHSRRASSSRCDAAAHRRSSFRGPIQDLLLPILAPTGILVRTPHLYGTAPLNGPPDDTRLADRCIYFSAASAGCSRSPATGAGDPARGRAVRRSGGLLHQPLPSAPQSVPHLDPGLPALRLGTSALPQGLPCEQQEG